MIITDKLLLLDESSLSFSLLKEELKKMNLLFSASLQNKKTLLPSCNLMHEYRVEAPDGTFGRVPVSLGVLNLKFTDFDSWKIEEKIDFINQIENILMTSENKSPELENDMKVYIIQKRLSQNKK